MTGDHREFDMRVPIRRRTDSLESLRSLLSVTAAPRELAIADGLLTRVSVGYGTVLCHERDVGRQSFLIHSGEVAVSRGGRFLARRGRGDWVGELALMFQRPRNATVTAISDCGLYVCTPSEFASLLDLFPELGVRLSSEAAVREPVEVLR